MKVQEFNKSKIPLVKINKQLDKFKGKVLFREKLDMANSLLKNAVLPKLNTEKK